MEKRNQGVFITLEGLDKAGKTTQMALLVKYLQTRGYNVVTTREPGGTGIGDQIREILLDPQNASMVSVTEILLYAAARAQHVAEVIKPALAAGKVVVCDRFTDSTVAYQGYGRGLSLELIKRLNALATQGLEPDITLLFDLPLESSLRRFDGEQNPLGAGQSDRIERERASFHARVREGYLQLAAAYPERVKRIDACGKIEEIHAEVIRLVEKSVEKLLENR